MCSLWPVNPDSAVWCRIINPGIHYETSSWRFTTGSSEAKLHVGPSGVPLSLPLAFQSALDLCLSFSFLEKRKKKRHFQMSWKTLKFLPLIFLNLKVNGKETMVLAVKFVFINVIFSLQISVFFLILQRLQKSALIIKK